MYCPSRAGLLRLRRGKRTAVPMTRLRSESEVLHTLSLVHAESSMPHLMGCQAFFLRWARVTLASHIARAEKHYRLPSSNRPDQGSSVHHQRISYDFIGAPVPLLFLFLPC